MLVYTTQVNSAFGARWLASLELIIQVLFTSEQPKRNKMASRFASISEKEILSLNKEAVPKNTKMATRSGVTVFNSKLFNLSRLGRKLKIRCLVYENCRALKSQRKQWNIWCFSAWFQQHQQFKSTIEEMKPMQLKKCLQKFYCSARRRDGTFYNKKSLTAIRAAIDRHLRSPPLNKPFSK